MKIKKKLIINNKKKNPFFSIITVVKNDDKNITSTIKSIIKQRFKNFEYIIVDGYSIDKTLKKIIKHKRKINLLISEKDKGIYFGMNKGIKLSNGKVVVFVNSGDTFSPNALNYVYKLFKKNKKTDFVFGTVKRNYTKSSILKYGFNKNKLKYNFDFATAHSTGFFVKRSKLVEAGFFNTKFKCSADYDLYYRLIIKNDLVGAYTKRNELVGEVMSGGFSSKISFISHLLEETHIRYKNNQNLLIILLIIINAIIKHLIKILFR